MGKRVKKKAQNGLKEKRVSTSSENAVLKENNHSPEIVGDRVVVVKERNVCPHFEKAVDVARVCSKLESAESNGCEDCREGMIDRKGSKGKGKNAKKKGGSKATWICLYCGHFSCGGVGFPNTPQTHAVRHASQSRHPLAIQLENNNLRWCFSCSTLIPVDTSDDTGEKKDVLSAIVKLLKKDSSKTASVDVEDIWFGSGSVLSNVKTENKVVSLSSSKDLFAVRGLVNLGNTCFFNSIMQNLLAMEILRDYILTFDVSMGPLTSAMKKIFIETSQESGPKNVINPRPIFTCICAKAPQFRGYQQQDSHELLRCLLDGLSAEDLCVKKSDKSSRENRSSLPTSSTFVDVIFGGEISSTVCCVECGHSSVIHEPFLDLSLPLPTKKPHPKKAQPASRTRKTKQPPKRLTRPRAKVNKAGNSHPSISGCDPRPSSSSQSSSAFKEVSLECSSSADIVEPGVVFDNKISGSQSNASTQVSENNDAQEAKRPDYPEQDTQSDAHEADSWLAYVEPVTQSDAQEVDSWLDFLEPVSLPDNQNFIVKSDDVSVSLETGSKDVSHSIDSNQDVLNSSEEIGVVTSETNVKPQSSVDGWEDDQPVMVQDNEVLLLTYNEDVATTLPVDDGEDNVDFVGFGDLFDEPEATPTLSTVSSNMQVGPYGNGFLAGNSTESDPDEVDNSDSPVSVESCLAYFVKPELLTGEHAWHCENCTKLQQEKRRKIKYPRASLSVLHKTISKDECAGSEDFVADSNGSSGHVENLKKHVSGYINGFTPALPEEQGERDEPESACSDATNASVCPQLPDEAGLGGKSIDCRSGYADHLPIERVSGAEEHDSEEDKEDDDIHSKSVKVMRSATKRILINKSPAILTVHLKRFAQDARGRLSKLNGHVVFKEFIDLRPYLDNRSMSDNCIYRLIGVVEHSGSMRGGHYVAYVRGTDKRRGRSQEENYTRKHNSWYHASDAYVRETTLDEVLRSEAYILFYEKIQL